MTENSQTTTSTKFNYYCRCLCVLFRQVIKYITHKTLYIYNMEHIFCVHFSKITNDYVIIKISTKCVLCGQQWTKGFKKIKCNCKVK